MAEPRVHTWATYVLIAANVAMFGYELAIGVHAMSPTTEQIVGAGASVPAMTTNGEWWRLGASMFLHIGLLHIALNMLCLWQGRIVETLFGRGAFVVIYLVAGLVGAAATLYRQPNVATAGASGAVFGVYGAFAAYLWLRRSTMNEAAWKATVRGIGMFLVINLVFGLSVASISMTAHVGGLIAGFLVAAGMLVKSDGQPKPARIALVAAAGVALVAAGCLLAPRSAPPPTSWFVKFQTVINEVEPKMSSLDLRQQAKAILDTQIADDLEKDILPQWTAACKALAAAVPAPEEAALHAASREFCDTQQEVWQAHAELLRATGDAKEPIDKRFRFAAVALRTAAAKFTTARKALYGE
ncbi:MAG: rhomboid family intramembrane serine protease [Kofleriaceae bacterium]